MKNNLCEKSKVRIIAGPCAVENKKQITDVSKCLKDNGLSWIRAGAFKPRVSPHSFQGLGKRGVDILAECSKKSNLKIISEAVDEESLALLLDNVDAIQIGTRNMTNYSLLKKIGQVTKKSKKTVMLKRGMSSTISEWLNASEYIKGAGNSNIVLCERGIRTFQDSTRFTLDIAAVPVLHKQTNYAVCVDVSHAAGNSGLVPSLAKAAIASGADALMLEIHPNPKNAKCDGAQQLNLLQFEKLLKELRDVAGSLGKEVI